MNDDSGNYALFAKQVASASHMTAAKVLDVIARVPGCSGPASDAASAHAHVRMKDAPALLHHLEEDCPKKLDQEYGKQEDHNIETQSAIQHHRGSAIFVVTHWLDSCGKDSFRKL